MVKQLIKFIGLWGLTLTSYAQTADSLAYLDFSAYLALVSKNHPMMEQARLINARREAALLSSRGGFDPRWDFSLDHKDFRDTEYYTTFQSELKIPNRSGIDLKLGFEENSGYYLNPENATPLGGLLYGGAELNLGRGLLTDKKRAAVRAAEIMLRASPAEQSLMLNDFALSAVESYWRWAGYFQLLELYREASTLAEERLRAVQQNFIYGDLPAIDTLEAYLQWQNRQLKLQEAALKLQKSEMELYNFLWSEKLSPVWAGEMAPLPLESQMDFYADYPNTLNINPTVDPHPALRFYDYKLEALGVEKQLKAENLKPELSLNYNFLTEAVGPLEAADISTANYKWGLKFDMPLFIREARGELKLTEIKIRETELERLQRQRDLQNKLNLSLQRVRNLERQYAVLKVAVENYARLLEGEKIKFANGESSLFLINSRESTYLDNSSRLIELSIQLLMARAEVAYAQGKLHQLIAPGLLLNE